MLSYFPSSLFLLCLSISIFSISLSLRVQLFLISLSLCVLLLFFVSFNCESSFYLSVTLHFFVMHSFLNSLGQITNSLSDLKCSISFLISFICIFLQIFPLPSLFHFNYSSKSFLSINCQYFTNLKAFFHPLSRCQRVPAKIENSSCAKALFISTRNK